MLITADQLLCHAFGDYVFQSDYMASHKTRQSVAALAHAVTYTFSFLLLTRSVPALLVIFGTHFVIDRWRLARYVCWIKNFLQPKFLWTRTCSCGPSEKCGPSCGKPVTTLVRNYPWSECSATGYHEDRPAWMSVWLLIIADNCLHVVCNGLAIRFL
jgi:hypothetical protein